MKGLQSDWTSLDAALGETEEQRRERIEAMKRSLQTLARTMLEEDQARRGVIRTYDPSTGEGVVVCDHDRSELTLAADALEGSIFRMLRQGQRVVGQLGPAGVPVEHHRLTLREDHFVLEADARTDGNLDRVAAQRRRGR